MSAPVERWLGLTNGERLLAHPRLSARSGSALIGLVVLLAFILVEALTPLLVNLIKLLVGRERPPAALIEAHGSSYPSGHAAYAGATTVILVLLFTTPGRTRRAWWAVAAVATAAMAWSRTYLQVHWLSDALAGATLGVGVALLSAAVVQILSTPARKQDDQPPRPISAIASSTES